MAVPAAAPARTRLLDLLQLPVFKKIDHGLRREEFLENRVEGSGSGLGGQLPVTFAEVLRVQVLSKDLAGEGGTQDVR